MRHRHGPRISLSKVPKLPGARILAALALFAIGPLYGLVLVTFPNLWGQ